MNPLEKDYFAFNIFLLKFAGMWVPPDDSSNFLKFLYMFYNSFWIVYTLTVYFATELLMLQETVSDVNELVKHLNMVLTHFLGTVKVVTWFVNRRKILSIMKTLNECAREYKKSEAYDPEVVRHEENKLKDRATKLFFTIGFAVALSSLVSGFATLLKKYNVDGNYVTDDFNQTRYIFNPKLPYFSVIPFEHTTSQFRYGCAVFWQFCPVLNYAMYIVASDTLYVALINCISCQIKLIKGAFKTIRPRIYEQMQLEYKPVLHETTEVNRELNKDINKGISLLQTTFDMCDRIEDIYTYLILFQVMVSLLVLCTCLYLVSGLPFGEQFMAESVYLIAVEMQLALYCFFGNSVTLQSEEIPLSLYEGDWFSADESFKRSMLITMTRMAKPLELTIGKFTALTLNTFVTIGRGSYSFFTVLRTTGE